MNKGDWVFDGCGSLGKIIHAPYEVCGRLHIDIALYSTEGERMRRQSPRMGGPGGFEPACSAEQWAVIAKPDFPLSKFNTVAAQVEILHPASACAEVGDHG